MSEIERLTLERDESAKLAAQLLASAGYGGPRGAQALLDRIRYQARYWPQGNFRELIGDEVARRIEEAGG